MGGRKALVTTLNDLFAREESQLNDRELSLISEILDKLLHDFAVAVRRELAERLAKQRSVPPDVIVALANDEIEVARPILLHSILLRDRELIDIIRDRTREHQLAIAMRQIVSEPVSDALVETGDVDVVTKLLRNENAHIAEATLAYLADEARHVDNYQEPLVLRQDLSPVLALRIYVWVSADLRTRLVERFSIEDEELGEELGGLVEDLISKDHQAAGHARSVSASDELAEALADKNQITSDRLVQVLRQGEIGLFESLFGRLNDIEPPLLQEVLYRGDGRNLAAACRAHGFRKARFAELFLLIRQGHSGSKVTDPRDLAKAVSYFDQIAPAAAQKVLRAWQGATDEAPVAEAAGHAL